MKLIAAAMAVAAAFVPEVGPPPLLTFREVLPKYELSVVEHEAMGITVLYARDDLRVACRGDYLATETYRPNKSFTTHYQERRKGLSEKATAWEVTISPFNPDRKFQFLPNLPLGALQQPERLADPLEIVDLVTGTVLHRIDEKVRSYIFSKNGNFMGVITENGLHSINLARLSVTRTNQTLNAKWISDDGTLFFDSFKGLYSVKEQKMAWPLEDAANNFADLIESDDGTTLTILEKPFLGGPWIVHRIDLANKTVGLAKYDDPLTDSSPSPPVPLWNGRALAIPTGEGETKTYSVVDLATGIKLGSRSAPGFRAADQCSLFPGKHVMLPWESFLGEKVATLILVDKKLFFRYLVADTKVEGDETSLALKVRQADVGEALKAIIEANRRGVTAETLFAAKLDDTWKPSDIEIDWIRDALASDDFETRQSAEDALVSVITHLAYDDFEAHMVPYLGRLLSDPEIHVRNTAARLIEESGRIRRASVTVIAERKRAMSEL